VQPRRGLVLEGGGAKGAYAYGCLLALRERGIRFDAVAGTSVGALNGLLWATDSLQGERPTWERLSQDVIYPRSRS
jgi:NTE family protein